jgi:uncharacterized protein (DUF1800 family)
MVWRTEPLDRAARRTIPSTLKPLPPGRFGFDEARHLLWRAGFGGSPAQVQTLVGWGLEKSVDHLLGYEQVAWDGGAGSFDREILRPPSEEERMEIARARRSNDEEAIARLRARREQRERDDRRQMRKIQHWWIRRMIESPRPLEEKMTLFWHGHFAASYRSVENSYHMFVQNETFRRHATGNFGDLLFAIIRDPAMLAFLNQNQSNRNKPNENLARELMELFSLGVGNYTERDIKEGARALTGFTFRDDEFVFNRANHDPGTKTILGKTGRLDGDDFVTAILERPECAAFITRKLYRFFAADYPTGRPEIDAPAAGAMREMARDLLAARYALRPVLRRLFMSEHFYDPALLGEQVKSPAVLVVGAVRSLNTPARDLDILADAMNLMGQNLFFPPSVAGWAGGRAWINTSTMFVRQNILCFLLTGKKPVGYDAMADAEKYDPTPLLADLARAEPAAADDPARVIDYLLRFTLGSASSANRETLREFVAAHGGRLNRDVITGMLLLITAMPEYQLC